MTRGAGRVPPGRSQSTRTIQRETVATSRAAIPEGTIFSAQETVPLPQPSHEIWRDGFDGDADGKVGGTPNDVDHREGSND